MYIHETKSKAKSYSFSYDIVEFYSKNPVEPLPNILLHDDDDTVSGLPQLNPSTLLKYVCFTTCYILLFNSPLANK